jgi:tetratricopeptide (TPR) repeat protein
MRPCLLALLLTAGLIQNQAIAQEKADVPVRLLYSAKNLAADKLHSVLEKHYDGVGTVKFVVEKEANLISIRAANQAALDDVLKTLATLDKTPRSIAFQGLVIDAAAAAEGAAAVELDRAQLTGSAEAVLAIARGWVKEGKAGRVRTFNWTGLENQVSEDSIGEIVPRVTGKMTTPRAQYPNYSDTNVGTLFSVAPRITEANDIICELIYNHSEVDQKAILEFKPDTTPIPPRIRQGRAQTTVTIPTGRSVVIAARDAGPDGPASLVVLSAVITNPNATPVPAAAPAADVAPARNPLAALAGGEARGGFSSVIVSPSASTLLSQYRTEEFGRTVKLTDDQKRKLEELAAERQKLMQKMSERMQSVDGRDRADEAAAFNEVAAYSAKRRELDERAVAVLTADQKKAFEKIAEEYKQASRDRLRERRFPDGMPTEPLRSGAIPAGRERLPGINRALDRSPNDPRLLLMRAQAYAAEEKWDDAITDYRKVMEIDPRNLAALTDLAAVLAFRGDEPGYRLFAEQLLERFGNESSPAEKLRVADACLLRSEWLPNAAVAESLLQAAIEAIPEGTSQLRGRIDIADAAFAAAGGLPTVVTTSVTAHDILAAKGRLHILHSQPDEAIKLLQPLVDEARATGRRLRPDVEISALCSLAIARLSKGEMDAANAALGQARNVQPQGSYNPLVTSSSSTFEITSKVRLQRAEQILRDAGAKPAPAK